jgi:hypothetical protein
MKAGKKRRRMKKCEFGEWVVLLCVIRGKLLQVLESQERRTIYLSVGIAFSPVTAVLHLVAGQLSFRLLASAGTNRLPSTYYIRSVKLQKPNINRCGCPDRSGLWRVP